VKVNSSTGRFGGGAISLKAGKSWLLANTGVGSSTRRCGFNREQRSRVLQTAPNSGIAADGAHPGYV
jgi:hypothetical protein